MKKIICYSLAMSGYGQCHRDDGHDEHDGDGDGVALLVGVQGQAGLGEKEVEQQHTGH